MDLCKILTGHTVASLGGLRNTTAAVHDALRSGIESGRLALLTFDGYVTHLVRAASVDPESSNHSVYEASVVDDIEVLLTHSSHGMDIELSHNDEPVIIELES